MSTAKSPLSPYEQRALSEIDRFKNDDPTWLARITEKIHKPIEALTTQALDNVVGDALGTVVKGLVGQGQKDKSDGLRATNEEKPD